MGGHHLTTRLCLCLDSQWYMYRHLVTVKVSVITGTNTRVQTDSVAFNQNWEERLHAKFVQRWRPVQNNWVIGGDLLKNVVDHWLTTLYQLSRTLHVGSYSLDNQLAQNIRFENFQCHILGDTTLVEFQLGTNHNHGSARVVNSFSE